MNCPAPLQRILLAFLCCLALSSQSELAQAQQQDLEIKAPKVILKDIPFEVSIKDTGGRLAEGATVTLTVGEKTYEGTLTEGEAKIGDVVAMDSEVTLAAAAADGTVTGTAATRAMPGWLAIVPSLLAIVLALVLRQVIPALFLGIWIGGALAYGLSVGGLWHGLLDTAAEYGVKAVNDKGHVSIILFSMMIGGMVGIISRNGGTLGIVNAIVRWASSARRGQVATWVLGISIFFDDYANTMVVGNTMRPVTDRLHISREKLAYLVDSTSAPVATLALVTTWIGFQVGLIQDAVARIAHQEAAYSVFLNSILYNFYPLLTILFVFLVAYSGRDFGPMLAAERRARTLGQVARPIAHTGESPAEAKEHEAKHNKPHRSINALVPVLVLVFETLAGVYLTGKAASEAGAVWGDHCSPISDTTILSSMASGCDHIDHVRTQLPYAVAVGAVAVVTGLLPVGYGLPWWGGLLIGAALLAVGLWFFGQRSEAEVGAAATDALETEVVPQARK